MHLNHTPLHNSGHRGPHTGLSFGHSAYQSLLAALLWHSEGRDPKTFLFEAEKGTVANIYLIKAPLKSVQGAS